MRFTPLRSLPYGLLSFVMTFTHTASPAQALIDDRRTDTLLASNGKTWRLVTDQVMGGVSQGSINPDRIAGRPCLRLSGSVSTQRKGGFIQLALDLANQSFDASAFDGIEISVYGNEEMYNLHLRTSGLWLPWQSYRTEFLATDHWQTVRAPFTALNPYRTHKGFDPRHLTRLGLLAIGREFDADLCVGEIRFYRNGAQRADNITD
jgi:hypothetical protein